MFKFHTFCENNLSLMTHAKCHKANKYHVSFTVRKPTLLKTNQCAYDNVCAQKMTMEI